MNAYLKDSRLADVLALIQVLAREKWAKRSEDGIVSTLQRKPQSGATWIAVTLEHPELFRVLDLEEKGAPAETKTALIARLLQPKLPPERVDEPERLAPLTLEETSKLLDLAVTLHDRAVQRKDRWKTIGIPIGASIISAGAVVASAIIAFKKPAAPPPAINVNPTIFVPAEIQNTQPNSIPVPADTHAPVDEKGR